MVKSIAWVLVVLTISCSPKKAGKIEQVNNPLVETLYNKDIEIRELDAKTDTVNLEAYDKKHREQIFQLLAENKIITPNDKVKAAWILQHTAAKYCEGEISSMSPENFLLAYKLSSSALEQLKRQNDTATIRKQNVPRIIALNYDRYLLYTYGFQKFGTQFVFDDTTGEMLVAPVDTTLSTDEERKRFNVEPLNQLLEKYKMKSLIKK
jgi:hypothetical protein